MSDFPDFFSTGAEVGEVRNFAGQPSNQWAPCTGGVLSQTAYAAAFARLGHRHLRTVTNTNGFSNAATGTATAARGFYAYGKYWLATSNQVTTSDRRATLQKATTFNGTPTLAGQGTGGTDGYQFGRVTLGPTHGVLLFGSTTNSAASNYVMFNDGVCVFGTTPGADANYQLAHIATDGAQWVIGANGRVRYRTQASMLAGGGSGWADVVIAGKGADKFGVIRNPVTNKWVTGDTDGNIWTTDNPAGPWVQGSKLPLTSGGDTWDFGVLANGDYVILNNTQATTYVSSDLVNWRVTSGVSAYGAPNFSPLFDNMFVSAGRLGTSDWVGPVVTGLSPSAFFSWDGSGFVYGNGSGNIGRAAPPYDMLTQFAAPTYAVSQTAPNPYVKVR